VLAEEPTNRAGVVVVVYAEGEGAIGNGWADGAVAALLIPESVVVLDGDTVLLPEE
jgi:hypothetical protein